MHYGLGIVNKQPRNFLQNCSHLSIFYEFACHFRFQSIKPITMSKSEHSGKGRNCSL